MVFQKSEQTKLLEQSAMGALNKSGYAAYAGQTPTVQGQEGALTQSSAQAQNIPATQQQQNAALGTTPVSPNAISVQPTYVPGLGTLGADIGGVAVGMKMAQDYRMAESENVRKNEYLGLAKLKQADEHEYLRIAQADLGIRLDTSAKKSYDVDQENQIQAGMANAMQQGGYGAVVDYLGTVAPERAVQFHAGKIKLDSMIMQSDVYQSQVPVMKTQAMMDAYAMGGKMSMAIMAAPEEMRAEMYKQMQPMIQQVIPGAPKEYGPEARSLGMLMAAQSTPESMLFASANAAKYGETELGKLNMAVDALNRSNMPDKQERMAELLAQKQALLVKTQKDQQTAANYQAQVNFKQGMDKGARALQYSNSLRQASTKFVESMNSAANIQRLSQLATQQKAEGKDVGLLLNQIQTASARLFQGGALTDTDIDRAAGAAGYQKVDNKIKAYLTGQQVALNPSDQQQVSAMSQFLIDGMYQQQKQLEATWQKSAGSQTYKNANNEDEKLVDWDNVALPSKQYDEMINPTKAKEERDATAKPTVRKYNAATGMLE